MGITCGSLQAAGESFTRDFTHAPAQEVEVEQCNLDGTPSDVSCSGNDGFRGLRTLPRASERIYIAGKSDRIACRELLVMYDE